MNKKQLILDYKNRMPKKDMEEKYGKSFDSLRVMLNRMGIKRGLPKYFKTQYDYSIEDIVNRYLKGESALKIANDVGCTLSNITRILKKENILIREAAYRYRKYKIDDTFFNNIDNHEKAYFLGFMYADGNVCGSNNTITLSLKESDKDILEFLVRLVSPDLELKYIKRNDENTINALKKAFGDFNFKSEYEGRYSISITNKKLHCDLINHGCIPNKSKVLIFPEPNSVPTEYINSFMLGYFDGDGSIYFSNGQPGFNIVGTEVFVKEYQRILVENCNINYTKLEKRGDLFSMKYIGKNNIRKIRKFLYSDMSNSLRRKREKMFYYE